MLLDDCAHLKTCMVNLLVIFILIDIIWMRFGRNVGVRFRECKPVLEKLVQKLECDKKGQTYANYYWHFNLFWDSKLFLLTMIYVKKPRWRFKVEEMSLKITEGGKYIIAIRTRSREWKAKKCYGYMAL